nr:MAG TPA: Terminase large subunit [Crassvirales sp.]DAP92668.1 MAG TPA: Terminase large subunit [Caudoviricetes sp.]
MIWEKDGTLKWVIKKFGDITHYPLKKDDDPTGSIVIWEHPVKDAPIGLYILGVDPYDHDQSGTNSLGSTFVYKRFQDFENYYDIIVAEYTGRPSTAEEYYENLRKLAVYYNGRIMYENERKGLFPYFTAKHCDYLLADQPDIISDVVGNSKVQRKKGCHMNK